MNHINIADFQISNSISGTYRISDLQLKNAKNGNTYLRAVLSDNSGSIDLICWEYSNIPSARESEFITVTGSVREFYNRAQFIAESVQFPTQEEVKTFDKTALVPAAPISVKDYGNRLYSMMGTITDQGLMFTCMDIFENNWESFVSIPAAQHLHHAFLHGLLMHTVDTTELANEAARNRREIDRDLLIAGALLHDVGKLREFELSPCTGLVTGYTEKGRLLGHAVLGFQMIEEAARNVKADPHLTAQLQHIVLTHHGDPTGNNFRQQSVEADLLRKLDAADSSCENKLESRHRANFGSAAASSLPNGPACDSDDRDAVDF